MFGSIFGFLIEIIFTLFGAALLIRAWIQAITMPRFNPLGPGIHRVTQWLVGPLEWVLPHRGRVNWACLVAVIIVAFVFIVLNWLITYGNLLPSSAWVIALASSVFTAIRWALNLIVWLTLIQAILSWVNPQAPMMPLLQTLTAPLLNPVRRLLPNTTIDFSPLIVLVLAQVAIIVVAQLSVQIFGF